MTNEVSIKKLAQVTCEEIYTERIEENEEPNDIGDE